MSTFEISKRSGASIRELQCWSDNGYVKPKREGWRRDWSEHDVRVVVLIKKLRDRHVSMRTVKQLLPVIHAAAASSLWLVKNGTQASLVRTRVGALERAEEMRVIEKLC